eukprot:280231-Hanusia_phi.AAC.1
MGDTAGALRIQHHATAIAGRRKVTRRQAMEELFDSTGQMYGVGGAGIDVGCLHQRILKPPLGVLSLSQQGIQRGLIGRVCSTPSSG